MKAFLYTLLIWQSSVIYGQASNEEVSRDLWINRIATAVRNGQGLSGESPLAFLRSLDDRSVVEYFMADPSFSHTLINFLMYYKGFSDKKMILAGGTIGDVSGDPDIVTGAQAILSGSNFLNFYHKWHPFYIAPVVLPDNPRQSPLPVATLHAINTIVSRIDLMLKLIQSNGQHRKDELCLLYTYDTGRISWIGLAELFPNFASHVFLFSPDWVAKLHSYCVFGGNLDNVASELLRLRAKFIQDLPPIIARTNRLNGFRSIFDFKKSTDVDASLTAAIPSRPYASDFWTTNVNSSTNRNRKRAAFILRNFFCDDMVPLDIVKNSIKEHAQGNEHLNSPTCRSCHYKLDPMAGFFRDHGAYGGDYYGESIVFDDGVVQNRNQYQQPWRGTARDWDVGYIRSATDESLNEYGIGMDDLYTIMKRAPEVHRCLTRKIWNYFVGPDQLVDPGLLDQHAKRLTEASEEKSGLVVREIIRDVLLSNALKQRDPDPSRCYDQLQVQRSSPPCEINHYLVSNCVNCHNAAANAGGLDLTAWQADATGQFNFKHVVAGVQQEAGTTFANLIDRMSTSDPALAMPKGIFINSRDRLALLDWFKTYAATVGP